MRNIRLVLEYDGTDYAGWQKQNDIITVQEKVDEAITKLTKEEVKTTGCSRTDAGVDAREFVCNFTTRSTIPGDRIKYALNNILPNDIVVLDSEEVESEFHARYDSTGKTYCYSILNTDMPSALYRNRAYHFRGKLDIEAMRKAASYFIGKHDFEAFRKTGSSVKTTVRTITESSIEVNGNFIVYRVSGDGFLYNMVRIMVGTLLDVGIGRLKPTDVRDILAGTSNKKAGYCTPPEGLILEKVHY